MLSCAVPFVLFLDVHGLRKAHDLHVWRPHPHVQRQRGGQPDVGAPVQRPVRLPLPGRDVEPPPRRLVQRRPRGRAVPHWTLHALPHCESTQPQDEILTVRFLAQISHCNGRLSTPNRGTATFMCLEAKGPRRTSMISSATTWTATTWRSSPMAPRRTLEWV